MADGHWGGEASELPVCAAVQMLLSQALESPGAPTPETSLVVCYVRRSGSGLRLYWASFGDSYLFVWNNQQLQQVNSLLSLPF